MRKFCYLADVSSPSTAAFIHGSFKAFLISFCDRLTSVFWRLIEDCCIISELFALSASNFWRRKRKRTVLQMYLIIFNENYKRKLLQITEPLFVLLIYYFRIQRAQVSRSLHENSIKLSFFYLRTTNLQKIRQSHCPLLQKVSNIEVSKLIYSTNFIYLVDWFVGWSETKSKICLTDAVQNLAQNSFAVII